MAGVFNSLKEILTYKPNNKKQFELLEGSDEGVERENTPEAANIKVEEASQDTRKEQKTVSQNKTGNKTGNKTQYKTKSETENLKEPLNVEAWNKQKNEKVKEEAQPEQTEKDKVSADLQTNMIMIKKEFGIPYNTDAMTREFIIAKNIKAFIAYIDGMVDRSFISDFVLRQLMDEKNFQSYYKEGNQEDIANFIVNSVISVHEIGKMQDLNVIYFGILSGDTALFIDGTDTCLLISARGYEKRSVEKPVTETVVMGSQEGFTENLRTNLTLVRKIIKNKNLITEMMKVGTTNQAYVGILYMNGIVNQEVVKEVKKRIASINAAFVMGDGMVGQFIEDNPFMIFPQLLTTERPDRVASFFNGR